MVTGIAEKVRGAIPHTSTVKYTGSNYEGNATKKSSDYDMMVSVAPKGCKFQAEGAGKPGFSKLKYKSGADDKYVSKCVSKDGYLSRDAVVRKQVQPAVDKLIGIQNQGGRVVIGGREVKVTRSVHGPAVTLDLKSGKHKAQLDIVASVDQTNVVGGKANVDYVAKPSKSQASAGEWRQSYSMQEKNAFKGVDQGNKCHREVLKAAKTVRANDPSLNGMPSYVVKMAQMNLMSKDDQRVSQGAKPKAWDSAHTADRLKDLGKEMYQGLDRADMRVPSNRAVNILEGTSKGQRDQWKRAIGPNGERLVSKAARGTC